MSDTGQPGSEEVVATADEPELIEGEGNERLIGIMYSERQWIVAPWIKVSFFWCSIALLAALVAYGVDKRVTMWRLTMDSVVEPTPLKPVVLGVIAERPLSVGPDGEKPLQLTQFRGKWVFLNFWATWCPPCRDEMPSMEMLARRFSGNLEMVAVSVDEDWGEINRFFGDVKPSFHVAWDRTKQLSNLFGTRKFPESFLIDPEGRVVVKFVGPRDWYNVGTVRYFEDILSGRRDPSSI